MDPKTKIETRLVCERRVNLRTKIPEPPIQFSGATNFLGPKNEFTSHQFETSVLEPPMSLFFYYKSKARAKESI